MRARSLVTVSAALLAAHAAGCDDPTGSSADIIVHNASSVSISQVHIRD
jgi:hypothetical protein